MHASDVALLDVIRSLAFVGDLAMGQPTDHSPRAAWMAGQLARETGGDDALCTEATTVALLRWSGCTANAPEFAQLFGDDVGGRKALLAMQSSGSGFRSGTRAMRRHSCRCRASIAKCRATSRRNWVWTSVDAVRVAASVRKLRRQRRAGWLARRRSAHVRSIWPSLAGDLDIFHRLYGLEQACTLIDQRAGTLYPRALASVVVVERLAMVGRHSRAIRRCRARVRSTPRSRTARHRWKSWRTSSTSSCRG